MRAIFRHSALSLPRILHPRSWSHIPARVIDFPSLSPGGRVSLATVHPSTSSVLFLSGDLPTAALRPFLVCKSCNKPRNRASVMESQNDITSNRTNLINVTQYPTARSPNETRLGSVLFAAALPPPSLFLSPFVRLGCSNDAHPSPWRRNLPSLLASGVSGERGRGRGRRGSTASFVCLQARFAGGCGARQRLGGFGTHRDRAASRHHDERL